MPSVGIIRSIPDTCIGTSQLLLEILGIVTEIPADDGFELRGILAGIWRHDGLTAGERDDVCDGGVGDGLANDFRGHKTRPACDDKLHYCIVGGISGRLAVTGMSNRDRRIRRIRAEPLLCKEEFFENVPV